MPKRNAEQKAARELQLAEGLGYQDALKRVRAETAAGPAATEQPAPQPPAVAYVLQPTPAELKAAPGITAEELGVRALPEAATPEQRAYAEAVWRPTEAEQQCRCTGPKCYHGGPCGIEYIGEGPCPGPMQHLDRHPGSMFRLTAWYDFYRCTDCGETYETTVELPELPWGEVRNRGELDGTERTLSDGLGGPVVTVIYQGIRHPNFPDHVPEGDEEDELDPDAYPNPENDLYGDEDQEEELDHLDDVPEGDADPAEDYDGPAEEEPSTPPGIPVTDLDRQPTAADWSPAFDLDNAPPSAW